jgi:hypothetical protein
VENNTHLESPLRIQKDQRIDEDRLVQTLQGMKESGLKVSPFFIQNFLSERIVTIVLLVLQRDPNEQKIHIVHWVAQQRLHIRACIFT